MRLAIVLCFVVVGCGDDGGSADTGLTDGGADTGPSDAATDGAMDTSVPMDTSAPNDATPAVRCSPEMMGASPFGGGAGTVDDPFIVCTTEHFVNVAAEPMGHFELWADLDLAGLPEDFRIPELEGTFDGRGHVISNYRFRSRFGGSTFGLFSVVGDDAVVRGLSLEGVTIDTDTASNVGPIAGVSLGSIIDCHVLSGTIVSRGASVGGIVGRIGFEMTGDAAEVRGCTSAIVIEGITGDGVGGIVGTGVGATLRLEDVHFTGRIQSAISDNVGGIGGELGTTTIVGSSSTGSLSGAHAIGGVVGRFLGGSIERSHATGEVQGVREVGGLVGLADVASVTISDSYSRVDIRDYGPDAFGTSTTHGGLVGATPSSASVAIERSFFAGSITIDVGTGTDYWGAALVSGRGVGTTDSFYAGRVSVTARTANIAAIYLLESYGSVTNVYYDADRSGLDRCWVNETVPSPECTAVNVGGGEPDYFFDPSSPPLNTWDFSATGPWMMVAGDYPALR